MRVCIERGRYWQAEYWISAVRDHALHVACRARGLDGYYGRDFDELPDDVVGRFTIALVQSLDGGELRRALGRAVAALLSMSDEASELAEMVGPQLRELVLDTAT